MFRQDIDGGMKTDIYEGMAEGVQGAAVVVPFMTSKYQASVNCKGLFLQLLV